MLMVLIQHGVGGRQLLHVRVVRVVVRGQGGWSRVVAVRQESPSVVLTTLKFGMTSLISGM